jgi:hypothetical protein
VKRALIAFSTSNLDPLHSPLIDLNPTLLALLYRREISDGQSPLSFLHLRWRTDTLGHDKVLPYKDRQLLTPISTTTQVKPDATSLRLRRP